jgi:hypothetical protein
VEVVGDGKERGGLGQQRQCREADEEAVAAAALEPQRAGERGTLDLGQLADPVQQRPQQLSEPGERKPGLRRRAGRAQHAQAGGPLAGVGEQRGLADPRLAADREAAADRTACVIQDGVERVALPASPVEHHTGHVADSNAAVHA